MEDYLNVDLTSECNQDTTTAVRNVLVEEDDAPLDSTF